MTPPEPGDPGPDSFRPRWLRPGAMATAILLHIGAIAVMTIPRPNIIPAEDSIELVIAQGAPEPEVAPEPKPPEPPPPPPPEPSPLPPDAPPPDLPPPPPPPEPVEEPLPPPEPPKVEVKEAPSIPIKPKPKPKPPPKPRPPDPTPPPPEAKAPGVEEAAAERARAQQTYASKLLAEIRRHKPSVTATGSAVVSFSVGPTGEMQSVTLVRSSGKEELDAAAVRMVRAAHAEPPPDGHFAGTTTINFVDR